MAGRFATSRPLSVVAQSRIATPTVCSHGVKYSAAGGTRKREECRADVRQRPGQDRCGVCKTFYGALGHFGTRSQHIYEYPSHSNGGVCSYSGRAGPDRGDRD